MLGVKLVFICKKIDLTGTHFLFSKVSIFIGLKTIYGFIQLIVCHSSNTMSDLTKPDTAETKVRPDKLDKPDKPVKSKTTKKRIKKRKAVEITTDPVDFEEHNFKWTYPIENPVTFFKMIQTTDGFQFPSQHVHNALVIPFIEDWPESKLKGWVLGLKFTQTIHGYYKLSLQDRDTSEIAFKTSNVLWPDSRSNLRKFVDDEKFGYAFSKVMKNPPTKPQMLVVEVRTVSPPNKMKVMDRNHVALSRSLHDLLSTGRDSDVDIRLQDGTKLTAHTLILTARSDVLRTMLDGAFQESLDREVDFTQWSSSVVRNFVNYLYTDQSTYDRGEAAELCRLSHFYDVQPLMADCLEACDVKNLSFSNLLNSHAQLIQLQDVSLSAKKKVQEIEKQLGTWIQDPRAPKDLRKRCYDLLFGEPKPDEQSIKKLKLDSETSATVTGLES